MSLTGNDLAYARMALDDPGSSAIQGIQIDGAIGGTFTLSFSGQTTAAIAYNAGSNVVQNALTALSNTGAGTFTVQDSAGAPGSMFWTVYLVGDLGESAQPMLTVNTTSLIGTGVVATVTQVAAGGVLAFSDSDLDILYAQADQNLYLTISLAFRALLGDLSRLHDYVAGQSQEKMSQVPEQIEKLADYYQKWAFAGQQVQTVRLRQEPPRIRAYPIQVGVPSIALSTRPGWRWGWRGRGGGDWQ